VSEITEALSTQLGSFKQRLDGETIDPSSMEDISQGDDEYYKTNDIYNESLEEFNATLDGVGE